MRWKSSIDIKSFDAVINSIKSLNEEWYISKKTFFVEEKGYNQSRDKILVKWGEYLEEYQDEITGLSEEVLGFSGVDEYTLLHYCWNSKFEGCLAYNNVELVADDPLEIHNLPMDAKTLCDSIINYYAAFFKGISDTNLIAQEIIANLKAIEEAFKITKDSSDFDKTKYHIYSSIYNKVYDVYGSHIILFNNHSKKSIDRPLTIDICNQIADFKLGNKKLITSVDGNVTFGEAIFHLLSYNTPPDKNIKIYVDEWFKNDVYYLLIRLSVLIAQIFNIAELERKQMLFLKTNELFISSSYNTFKAGKYKKYLEGSTNKVLIDSQLTALFS